MMKLVVAAAALVAFLAVGERAHAGPDYLSGHISNVTFGANSVLVMLDTGLPDNCAGSPYGWMLIPGGAKVAQAFVLGLWLRGDAAQTSVYIYTTSPPSSGAYCEVTQIDPQG